MASVNTVILKGNITRDPELNRVGQSNIALCKLALGVTNYAKKQGQEKPEGKPCYIEVPCWGDLAEKVSQLKKGDEIVVSGSLHMDVWQDKQSGANRNKHWVKPVEVVATKRLMPQQNQAPAPQQQMPFGENSNSPQGGSPQGGSPQGGSPQGGYGY
jgi:single-strand DNA-binding protein